MCGFDSAARAPDAERVRVLAVALLVVLGACQAGDLKTSSTGDELTSMPVTTHDFGSLQIGQMTGAYTFTINPAAGNNDDIVTSITESCPDFSVNAPNLPAEVYRICDTCTCPAGPGVICPVAPVVCCTSDSASYQFDTYFSPTVAGTVSCTVTISLNNGATTRLVTLTGTGTSPPIHIDVQPGSINFGDVRRNTDSTAVGINVSNTGGATMTVNSVSITPGFNILSGPTTGYTVGPGGTQPYSVNCHPTATGPLNGSFTVKSDDPNRGSVTVPLACNGIDSNLTISPSPVTLANTRVGEPVQQTVQLVNSGNAAMQLESVSVTGQDLSMVSGPGTMALGAGASTNITVAFAAGSKESASGSVDVTYDGGQTRSAQVNARALATSMAVTPDGDIDFGPVCSGQTSQQQFAILANDEGSFKVDAISTPAAPFTAMVPVLPVNVQGQGGSMMTFSVTAAPTTAGHQVSTMMVTTDIPGGSPHMINLAVDGLTAGVSPTPDSIDFGSNPIETTTIGQQVHLSNCSTAAITAMNARIEGPDASEFAIVQQPDSAMIQPTSSASWLVVLQAHTTGPKMASFVVDYDGGTAMVPLAGEGLGDTGSGSGPTGEKSYYSCAVGGSGGGWPIAAALALVTVRRRRRPGALRR
jgi:hypothetical protein